MDKWINYLLNNDGIISYDGSISWILGINYPIKCFSEVDGSLLMRILKEKRNFPSGIIEIKCYDPNGEPSERQTITWKKFSDKEDKNSLCYIL